MNKIKVAFNTTQKDDYNAYKHQAHNYIALISAIFIFLEI